MTTIYSTSDILAQADGLSPDQSARFLRNLLAEAKKLSATAQEVLVHYEPRSERQTSSSELSAFERLLEQNGFFLEDFEAGKITNDQLIDNRGITRDEIGKTRRSLTSYQKMANALPIAPFIEAGRRVHFNPFDLRTELQVDLSLVLFRMAHLPTLPDIPRFGLLQCDAAGAVLYRKQLRNFGLPRFGGACPLWPVYRSLAQPMQPISAMLDMPSGERFYSLSLAYPTTMAELGLPAPSESVMLFSSDVDLLWNGYQAGLPQIDGGLHCTVCPRKDCAARRNDYLLGARDKNR